MQIDSISKMIYVHIPRTGGSWFTYAWNSHAAIGDIFFQGSTLVNKLNGKSIECGRHGRLSGNLEKLHDIKYDYSDHKIITIVRHPLDRIGSSWTWFSLVKSTAQRHGWKSIDDMLDEYESGGNRSNYLPQTFWLEEQGAKWDIIYKFEDILENYRIVNKTFPLFNQQRKNNNLQRQGNRLAGMTNKQKKRIKDLYSADFKYLSKFYEY